MFKPFDFIRAIYSKDKSIRYVNEQWVPIYLNKALSQDKDNSEAIGKAVEYCLYLTPTNYYYLLFLLIPKKSNYYIKPVKKAVEEEPDLLVEKVKEFLCWSDREYKINKREFDKAILGNRDYWETELAVEQPKKRTTK